MRPALAPAGARSLIRWAIIAAALVLAAGCSTLRLAYSGAPQVTWWWLDGYADFTSEQSGPVRAEIDRWFEWHRATQLSGYAAMLDAVAAQTAADTTPQQVCRWQAQALEIAQPAIDRALVQAAAIVPRLTEAQLRHLEQRFAKADAEVREEFLQPDPVVRQRAAVKRAVERWERLYGRLDEPQRRVIERGVAASPFDPQLWMAERERRAREIVGTLRRLVAERADGDQRVAALRALAEHAARSPDPAYRSYREHLAEYHCAFFAQIHNATTPAQRQAARSRLLDWSADLRSLASVQP